ncbi:MAG: Aspartyl/glutamyl-tRNA(Asn/Gln) amidotransferase subunit B [Spirochaetes bacterium ADurb.Bin215]|nr:MAG: Aspartyl/glutamyl-tRNA(Asn/Gln) amidotransferase subunit B [Spirochaetes bacterium ADurb.Bin215]
MSGLHKDGDLTYEILIGCEIHCELKTPTKAFCACENRYGGMPNTRVCPVCLGLPGAMPVPSKEFVELGAAAGYAFSCGINRFVTFDRKHYFYPDLVKGYQITQYDIPLCHDGHVMLDGKKVRLERIHLEEDVGKSIHREDGRSCIDFNRSGVPLIEIVSKPDLSSPEEAALFMQTVREILRYIGVTEGNLEEGAMRCDANINLKIVTNGTEYRTPISEIKNMNSFRSIRDACTYEAGRQLEEFRSNRQPYTAGFKNTMGWDDAAGRTVIQRTKNSFTDYRFVVEPDIPPVILDDAFLAQARSRVGELPAEKRDRFRREYGLSDSDAKTLTSERELAEWFEDAAKESGDPGKVANWILGELLAVRNDRNIDLADLPITPAHIAALVNALGSNIITSRQAKDVFAEMLKTGELPSAIIRKHGMEQMSDTGAIGKIVAEVFAENPAALEDYAKGKTNVVDWLTGQVMKKSRGQANPGIASELVQKRLADFS